MSMFDWISLGSGRARFAGALRGWNALGCETFAAGFSSHQRDAEVAKAFTTTSYNSAPEITCLGYRSSDDVGVRPSEAGMDFAASEIERIRTNRSRLFPVRGSAASSCSGVQARISSTAAILVRTGCGQAR